MNCQDHLYRRRRPRAVARRWFLEQCGVGLGAMALAPAARRAMRGCAPDGDRGRRPARAAAAALRPEGEARHLPVHGRRAEPARAVRQQAAAREVRRHAAAGRAAQGLPRGVHQPELEAARAEVQVRQARPERAPSSRSCCPHLAKVVDDIAIVKSMATDAFNHAPGADPDEHRLAAVRPAEHGRVGRPTASAASRRTCPASSSSAPASKGPSGGNSNWGSGFLPTVYQGVPFRTGGDPVLYLSNPRGRRRRAAARLARRRQASSTSMRLDATSATRRSPRGSTRTRWPSGCRRARPELMDLASEPQARPRDVRRRAGQAVVRQQLPAGPPAGRARRAVRRRSSTRPGTSTATSSTTSSRTAATPTRPARRWSRTSSSAGCSTTRSSIWGGEFGRTPMVQGGNDGRDHHPNAFTMWLAGGGIKPGITLGETDDLGFNVVEGPRPRPRPARDDPAPARLRPHAGSPTASRAATSA